ncbi:MAG TPA: response regulator [Planctomycetota bacterium]|nr:response regulator [Planctomycetota bacterium]
MSTVLIVDDEVRILTALRRSLRREGFQVLTAEGPREALRILETTAVDLVLSDHKMPGMTGSELLREIARRWPGVVRLLITGWAEAVSDAEVREIGIRELIPKPWDDAELKAALRRYLDG